MFDLYQEFNNRINDFMEYNSKNTEIPPDDIKQAADLCKKAEQEINKYQKCINTLKDILKENKKNIEAEKNKQYLQKYMKLTDNRYIYIISINARGIAYCEVINTHYIGRMGIELFSPLDDRWDNSAPRLIDEAIEIPEDEYLRRKAEVLKLFQG